MEQAISEITAWLGPAFRGQKTPLKNQCKLQSRTWLWVALFWWLLVHQEPVGHGPTVQRLSQDA